MVKRRQNFQERRKYMRLDACLEIRYAVIGRFEAMDASLQNISAGGVCIVAQEQFNNDTPLHLEIKIPELKSVIMVLGRVVWQKKLIAKDEPGKICFASGIEFTGINDFDRFNINRYIIEHLKRA